MQAPPHGSSIQRQYLHPGFVNITRNRQVTLAVYPVTKGTSNVAYITRCLDAIAKDGLKIQAVCLDREFYAYDVIEFLTTAQVPFILPVRKHSQGTIPFPVRDRVVIPDA